MTGRSLRTISSQLVDAPPRGDEERAEMRLRSPKPTPGTLFSSFLHASMSLHPLKTGHQKKKMMIHVHSDAMEYAWTSGWRTAVTKIANTYSDGNKLMFTPTGTIL